MVAVSFNVWKMKWQELSQKCLVARPCFKDGPGGCAVSEVTWSDRSQISTPRRATKPQSVVHGESVVCNCVKERWRGRQGDAGLWENARLCRQTMRKAVVCSTIKRRRSMATSIEPQLTVTLIIHRDDQMPRLTSPHHQSDNRLV